MQGVKDVTKQAFIKSIPIMCSYVFVSMAYGMMMENADLRGIIRFLQVLLCIQEHSSLS